MTHTHSATRAWLAAHWPELALLAAALAARLAFALLPLELLFVLLEDDAWMVAAIARHWALGHGITADGLNPTNGFHPLYPLTLGALPYLAAPGALDAGLRANLVICALLSTLALLPFYGLARALMSRPLALTGLAVLALNPLLIRISVNGMETALALLLLLTLWWYALVRFRLPDQPTNGPSNGGPPNWRGAALLGLLAGLAILARLDSGLAAGLLGLLLLARELWARRWPLLSAVYGGVAGLLLLPYVARNLLEFGALTPSSGRALAYMHSFAESFALTSGLQLVAYQTALDLTTAPQGLLLAGGLLLAALFLTLPPARRWQLAPLVGYALLLAFYYSYLQQQGRPRYYVAVGAVTVLLVGAWLTRWQARGVGRESRPLVLAGLLGMALLVNGAQFARHVHEVQTARYQAQPAMYQAARWIATNLPPDARLAAQNSGIFQYYSERVVLNIDGKLNHEIIPVLEQRALAAYLREREIAYVVDLPGVAAYIEFYSASLSDAPPHPELSSLDKLGIYGRKVAARLGLGPPVVLAERVPERVRVPFGAQATEVQRFPLPNDPNNAVLIYRLDERFGAQR